MTTPGPDALAHPADASLTIVIIVLAGGAALARCLQSTRGIPARRIVVGPEESSQALPRDADGVERLLSQASVPERRELGLRTARSEWVALVEDTCELAESWYSTFLETVVTSGKPAWGGPVALAPNLAARNIALGCVEYGEFTTGIWQRLAHGPAIAGVHRMSRIAGICLTYRRLTVVPLLNSGGLVEPDLHFALETADQGVHLHPGLLVTYSGIDPRGATAASRFTHGRIYGGGLAERVGVLRRVIGAVKCLALPVVLSVRALRGLPASYPRQLSAFAWMAIFAGAWSAGEMVGLLAGRTASHRAWA